MNLTRVRIHVEPWVEQCFVDPVTHLPLHRCAGSYRSESGFSFPINEAGIPDFRITPEAQEDRWTIGQRDFEQWLVSYLDHGQADPQFHSNELKGDEIVYRDHPLNGDVLDVGGQMGFVRSYSNFKRFVSIDPFLNVPRLFDNYTRVIEVYRLDRPLNFIGGIAEYLPFKNGSFDTINMRSCIDHFSDPVRALCEAWRVLRPVGTLVVGNSYNRHAHHGFSHKIKTILGLFIEKYAHDEDHHTYNPESPEVLRSLVERFGFKHQHTTQQKGLNNVYYSSFLRLPNHKYIFGK